MRSNTTDTLSAFSNTSRVSMGDLVSKLPTPKPDDDRGSNDRDDDDREVEREDEPEDDRHAAR
jgi:hypothetical protein